MNKGNSFSPSRLKAAREFRGWTGTKLAQKLGVSSMAVSGWEDGKWQPAKEVVEDMATELKFPFSWFQQDEISLVDNYALSFRAQSRMSQILRKQSARTWDFAALLAAELRDQFDLPSVSVPDYSDEELLSPEEAANRLRHEWRLGFNPVDNLVALLESKGIFVFWTDIDSPSVDAYCHWDNDNPIIVLNLNQRAGERSRFNAAHELGHLVLHREAVYKQKFADDDGGEEDGETRQKREQEAHAFASAFLLPRESFGQESPLQAVPEAFIPLKKRWKVSIAAMLRRNADLGYFSKDQYERAMTRLTTNKWRIQEPGAIVMEDSTLHRKVFDAFLEDDYTIEEFVSSVHMSVEDACVLMPLARQYLASELKTPPLPSNVLLFPRSDAA